MLTTSAPPAGAQRVTYNEALETLTAMFPGLSPDVIKMVLELHVSTRLPSRLNKEQYLIPSLIYRTPLQCNSSM